MYGISVNQGTQSQNIIRVVYFVFKQGNAQIQQISILI